MNLRATGALFISFISASSPLQKCSAVGFLIAGYLCGGSSKWKSPEYDILAVHFLPSAPNSGEHKSTRTKQTSKWGSQPHFGGAYNPARRQNKRDIKGLCRKEILFAIDHFNQIVRHELLRMISWKVGIETGFKLSVGKNYKFIERYISEDLWEKLLSTYRMDSYENIWEALFLCHQLFRAVSGEVAERLHYAYPEYDRNITKYTRDMYKKYTGKTGCLDSTYAADIEERREQ